MGNCIAHPVSNSRDSTQKRRENNNLAVDVLITTLPSTDSVKIIDSAPLSLRSSRASAKVSDNTESAPSECLCGIHSCPTTKDGVCSSLESNPVCESVETDSLLSEPQENDSSENVPVLIPGLPNALALQCLAKLTVREQCVLLAVDRQWRELAKSKELAFVRREMGLLEDWLFLTRQEEPKRINGQEARLYFNLYDAQNKVWIDGPLPTSVARCCYGHRTAMVDGKFYLMTGSVEILGAPTNQFWKYDVQTNSWHQMASMKTPRLGFGIGIVRGKIVVVGGRNDEFSDLNSVEVYDPKIDEWCELEPMAMPRGNVEVAVIEKLLYVVERGQIVEVYDPESRVWQQTENTKWCSLLSEKKFYNLVSAGENLFCIEKSSHSFKVIQFNRKWQTWREVAGTLVVSPKRDARLQPRLALVSGKLFAVGFNFSVCLFHPVYPSQSSLKGVFQDAENLHVPHLRTQRTELVGGVL